MKNIRITILATLCLGAAAPGVYAQTAVPSKAAGGYALALQLCLDIKTNAAVQKACIAQVEQAMGNPPAPGALTTPPRVAKVSDAPPEVKRAAQQLGLAGSPAPAMPGAPAAAAPPVVDISGMDPRTALQAVQQQQDAIFRQQAAANIAQAKERATMMEQIQDASTKLKGAPKTKAGNMMTIGSGAEGAKTVGNMRDAGLDTSKVKESTGGDGQKQYDATAAQMDAFKSQVDAKMAALGAAQQQQAAAMQSAMVGIQQNIEILTRYIGTLDAMKMASVGNMH